MGFAWVVPDVRAAVGAPYTCHTFLTRPLLRVVESRSFLPVPLMLMWYDVPKALPSALTFVGCASIRSAGKMSTGQGVLGTSRCQQQSTE